MGRYSIKKAAALMIVVTVIEKILGFGREMVIASQFGASGLTDAYNAGYLIPYFIMALLYAGLVNVYAPLFLAEKEIDEEQAWNKINSISTYLVLLLFFICLMGALFSKYIVHLLYPGFTVSSLNTTASISGIFFIGVFIYSITIIEGSLLNCFREFVYPIIAVCVLSLGTIIFVIAFGGRSNINSIAYGYIAGAIAGVLIQYLKLKSIKARLAINFRVYKEFGAKFFGLLFPVLIATSMTQANVFVDRIFASYLPEGSMSYLSYGNKVVELPISLFSGIIATIIFPDIIEYINSSDNENLKVYFNRAMVITLIFLIPSMVGLGVLNKEVVKLLYERNVFDSTDTVNTASALVCYSPTIIMYGCTAVVSKVYYSLKDTKTLMNISILTIAMNGVLDYILMKPLGHNGLALATSIVSVFQFASAYMLLKRKIDLSMRPYMLKGLTKITASSIFMAVVIYMIKLYIPVHSAAASVGLSIVIGAGAYFIMLIVLRVDELNMLREKFNRGKSHMKK